MHANSYEKEKGSDIKSSTRNLGTMIVLITVISVILIILSLIVLSLTAAPKIELQRSINTAIYVVGFILVLLLSISLHFFVRHSEAVEDASKAKDYFIANISHEIKTPLNAIVGMAHMLRHTDLSSQQQELVSKIDLSSDLLLNLINDILDFSKMKNNVLNFYSHDFLLKEVLEEIQDIFFPLLTEKGLKWSLDYDFDENLALHTDRIRLTQVLLNLMSNALKFTEKGYIKLTVRCLPYNNTKAQSISLLFCLEDTGIGIENNDGQNLFNEFVQLENHLTKQHKGTGLGLALCKHIVNHLDGEIWYVSNPNAECGTQFNFTICTETADKQFFDKPLFSNTDLMLNGMGQKILVAEDTEISYDVVRLLLEQVNIICDHATDGLEAIRLCDMHSPGYYQVILMDIHMPNMDGYTASSVLKTEKNIATPILALTATNVDAEVMKKYHGILDGFILKPFKYTELHKMLLPYFTCNKTCCKMEEAIENMGDNEQMYQKHLSKFQTNYADVSERIETALLAHDLTEAHRLTHSTKGLAATLGLTCLQLAAKNLEDALAMDFPDDEFFTLLVVFRAKLTQALTVSFQRFKEK